MRNPGLAGVDIALASLATECRFYSAYRRHHWYNGNDVEMPLWSKFMSESDILDPPLLLPIPVGGDEAWKREYVAFLQLLPELLTNLRDKYVAVHDGAVVAVADSFKDAALQAYERC